MNEFFIRFRTWIFNVFSIFVLILPDLLQLFSATDWSGIIPDAYIRLIGVAIAVINIWMRPRPAVLPSDPEASK